MSGTLAPCSAGPFLKKLQALAGQVAQALEAQERSAKEFLGLKEELMSVKGLHLSMEARLRALEMAQLSSPGKVSSVALKVQEETTDSSPYVARMLPHISALKLGEQNRPLEHAPPESAVLPKPSVSFAELPEPSSPEKETDELEGLPVLLALPPTGDTVEDATPSWTAPTDATPSWTLPTVQRQASPQRLPAAGKWQPLPQEDERKRPQVVPAVGGGPAVEPAVESARQSPGEVVGTRRKAATVGSPPPTQERPAQRRAASVSLSRGSTMDSVTGKGSPKPRWSMGGSARLRSRSLDDRRGECESIVSL
mmetsp:Transcript_85185/g.198057  ORF Transcript_85185/g.198057 Transcript_85185/m.198057 type:complete len:310 (+) Transcript_85185:1-930(+)